MQARRPDPAPLSGPPAPTGQLELQLTATRPAKKPRSRHIDVLKGACTLWVLCIHAEWGVGSAVFNYAVNRAVPLFLVSFGATSARWWDSRRAKQAGGGRLYATWMWQRLRRVLPPFWLALATWAATGAPARLLALNRMVASSESARRLLPVAMSFAGLEPSNGCAGLKPCRAQLPAPPSPNTHTHTHGAGSPAGGGTGGWVERAQRGGSGARPRRV